MSDFLSWLREIWDRVILSDHEWKKKYCPHLYHYLFEMTDKERHEALCGPRAQFDSRVSYVQMLRMADHSDEDIVFHMKNEFTENELDYILNTELPRLYKCWESGS